MLIELTAATAEDQEHIDHLLHCEEHREEFFAKVLEMMAKAVRGQAPARITMLSTEVVPTGVQVVRGELRPGTTYRLAEDGTAILCLRCGMTSHHPEDVRNLFCGRCKHFHERGQV